MCEKKLNKRNKIDINYNRRHFKCGVDDKSKRSAWRVTLRLELNLGDEE